MNILKIGKLTLAALAGSLMWVGCASTPTPPPDQPMLETTIDPQDQGPDTQPQFDEHNDLYSPFQSSWTIRNIE